MGRSSSVQFVESTPERRQIAKVLTFDAAQVFAISWDAIATVARELGSHFEARSDAKGNMTVTMFWAYDNDE